MDKARIACSSRRIYPTKIINLKLTKMKVLFVKSPTAVFKLAYSAGETADLPTKLAKNLVKDGYAVEPEKETKAK